MEKKLETSTMRLYRDYYKDPFLRPDLGFDRVPYISFALPLRTSFSPGEASWGHIGNPVQRSGFGA